MKNIWKRWQTYVILGFVAAFLFMVSEESKADTIIEAAGVVAYAGDVQDDTYAVLLHERMGKWDFGVILLSDEATGDGGDRGFEVLRNVQYKSCEMGIGVTKWANETSYRNTKESFALMLGCDVWDNWTLRLRHWSTGGTSTINGGLDMLTLSYQFGK